ncbi:parallel beta-helix repeat protein [Undibacterium sp. GrIS 1.8]|uniref:chondroitinase-B domain-containing protein n=1 Tax=unclassified Undibacterium TaxID=2630295 RepID=UPI003394341A
MPHKIRSSRPFRRYVICLLFFIAVLLAIGASVAFFLQNMGVTPRALSPYIERRTSDHNPTIVSIGEWMSKTLMVLDRGTPQLHTKERTKIGAQTNLNVNDVAPKNTHASIIVASNNQIIAALSNANPGDVITLLPGTYRFVGTPLLVNKAGSKNDRITLRAAYPGTVFLEFNLGEGFQVSAPYWTFENLSIRGVCQYHENCEHAFHVTGDARYFMARNNTIIDFNAHFKINGSDGHFPDHGLIEGNTLTNTSARKTSNPVTLIDLVAASDWVIRKNWIGDFIKDQGDRISYGAFAKGAGSRNVFEQNMVICEHLLQGTTGQRVGLSLGGGGTGKEYCRDTRCITEQDNGVIQSNLIASCSDDGIYINHAAGSKIIHNTIVDTAGVTVRFPDSSANLEGNLVDGAIRSRDQGILHSKDNLETPIAYLYFGYHPVRRLFSDSNAMDFVWKNSPPHRSASSITNAVTSEIPADLCDPLSNATTPSAASLTAPQVARRTTPSYGAFEDFSACLY